jgi:hypothetical protein
MTGTGSPAVTLIVQNEIARDFFFVRRFEALSGNLTDLELPRIGASSSSLLK